MTEIFVIAVFFDGLQQSASKKLVDIGFTVENYSEGTSLARKRIFQGGKFDSKTFHDELLRFKNKYMNFNPFNLNHNLDIDILMDSKEIVHLDAMSILLMGEMKMGIGMRLR